MSRSSLSFAVVIMMLLVALLAALVSCGTSGTTSSEGPGTTATPSTASPTTAAPTTAAPATTAVPATEAPTTVAPTTTAAPQTTTTVAQTTTTAVDAAALFAKYCTGCHKRAPGASASRAKSVITNGTGEMPGFKNKMTADQIAALAAWVAAGGK
jgi:mono/diheme cytochrome c family protein